MRAVLSAHALIVAVIFGAYLLLMAALVAWIWLTGHPRGREDRDDPEETMAA